MTSQKEHSQFKYSMNSWKTDMVQGQSTW